MAVAISIVIEPTEVQIQAGGRASARVTLLNRGNQVGQYALTVSGVDPTWCSLDTPQIGVFPSDRSSLQLAIRLPANVLPATYQVIVQAVNQLDPSDQAATALPLTVTRSGAAASSEKPPLGSANNPAGQSAASMQPTIMRPQAQNPVSQAAGKSQANTSTSASAASAFGEIVLKAASHSGQVQLVVDSEGFKLAPGANQSLHLGLTNTGGVALPMEVAIKGAPLSWLSLAPSTLSLAPGETQYITLTATIPTQTPLGSYPLTLLAQSGEDANLTARVNLMLEVLKAGALTLELTPSQVEGETSGIYELRASQTGDAELSAALSAKDSGGLLDFIFTPATLHVPISGSAKGRLTVRPRQALSASDTLSIAFEVTATPGGGAGTAISAQGRFTQRRAAQVKMFVPSEDVRGPAGASYTIQFANPGSSATSYRLSAGDASANCQCQFAPATLTVPANGQASSLLRVIPIAALTAGELVHTIRVSAQPTSGLGASLTGALRYVQTADQPPTLAINPASQTSTGAVNYTLQIINPRSTPLQMALQPYDPNQQCRLTIDPPVLTIPAQSQAVARLNVEPLGQLLSGETRRVCTFNVAGYVDTNPTPLVAEGTLLLVHGFTWRKLLPLFLVAFALLGIGVVIIMVLLYWRFYYMP
jgi:hypothetical protein